MWGGGGGGGIPILQTIFIFESWNSSEVNAKIMSSQLFVCFFGEDYYFLSHNWECR